MDTDSVELETYRLKLRARISLTRSMKNFSKEFFSSKMMHFFLEI
jgi:hypothetical protein